MSDNVTVKEWKKAQVFESSWHNNCVNSYWEETKQQVYARLMGLNAEMVEGKFPVYDLKGKSILDIGAGPYSLLLKCINGKNLKAIDPCDYPRWTWERYLSAGIQFDKFTGEEYKTNYLYDEVWIYNVLQHVKSPQTIIKNSLKWGRIIRIFEWIDNGVSPGHPHDLKEDKLNKWLGGIGQTKQLNISGCNGKAYFGIFKGNYYEIF